MVSYTACELSRFHNQSFKKQTLPLDIHILFVILLCFTFASTDGAYFAASALHQIEKSVKIFDRKILFST